MSAAHSVSEAVSAADSAEAEEIKMEEDIVQDFSFDASDADSIG